MYFILALFAHSKSSDVSIHGLWPQYSENSWPEYCTDIKFDLSLIKSLLLELKKHWYSYNGRNEHVQKKCKIILKCFNLLSIPAKTP